MKAYTITKSITNRDNNALRIYFKDINKHSLLSKEEELDIVKKIKSGDEQAKNKLITSNLRFVISIAKKYQNNGLDLNDLIQEGSLGLINAVNFFDESKGYKFISFAVWYIRQAITKALTDTCRVVRVPLNQITNVNKVKRAINKVECQTGKKASIEEISKLTNLSSSKINNTETAIKTSVSLDTPISDSEGDCLINIIPDKETQETDYLVEKDDKNKAVEYILSKLSPRKRDIIRMSFGIGMYPMLNDDIANYFGIGSERVRQIEKETIAFLQKKYKNKLKDLL